MGELRTRKRGKSWEWSFEGAKIGGKRKPISKGGYRTKADALAAGTQAKAEYDNAGSHFVPSEISVTDFYSLWLEDYCKINLKENTYRSYRKKVATYILPSLGKYRLNSLTPSIIQKFLNEKFNQGYSRNTLSVLKGMLTGGLSYAVEPLHYLKINPALGTKIPSKRATPENPTRKKEKEVVAQDQWDAIIKRFPEGHSSHVPLMLAYRCGLRLGEAFALTWEDIDFNEGNIDINKQVQKIDNKWIFSNPKYDSFRTIRADSKLLSLLAREKERQKKAKEFYADYYTKLYVNEKRQLNSDGEGSPIWMVNSRENGTYIQPDVIKHCARIIHYQLGYMAFDFHSLRHTHATMLLENGAFPKDVQIRLGHKNIEETLQIYAHLTKKMQDKSVDIMETIP